MEAFIMMMIFCGIIISILIFGAIMKMYDISNSLKDQNGLLLQIIEEMREQNKIARLQQPKIATNVTAERTPRTDISE